MTSRITIEPGKRSGQPCVRGLRITVWDVLSWLARGMTEREVLVKEQFHRATRRPRTASQSSVASGLDAPDKGRGAALAARGSPDHGIRGRSRTRRPGSGPRLTA